MTSSTVSGILLPNVSGSKNDKTPAVIANPPNTISGRTFPKSPLTTLFYNINIYNC